MGNPNARGERETVELKPTIVFVPAIRDTLTQVDRYIRVEAPGDFDFAGQWSSYLQYGCVVRENSPGQGSDARRVAFDGWLAHLAYKHPDLQMSISVHTLGEGEAGVDDIPTDRPDYFIPSKDDLPEDLRIAA